jgi:protein-tyrosine-phosphatase
MTTTDPLPFDRALDEASEIVFVCTGNMVRSAFAELYARHLGCPLPIRSGATTYRNTRLFPETKLALTMRGVPLGWCREFRPTHLDDLAPHVAPRALILCMTEGHLEALERYPGLPDRAHLLSAVLGDDERIADPVEEGADFVATFDRVERCVDELVSRLKANAGA